MARAPQPASDAAPFAALNINPEVPLQLKFIVIGGSIGGQSAAATLSASGHQVVVLEKNEDDPARVRYGGIQRRHAL